MDTDRQNINNNVSHQDKHQSLYDILLYYDTDI